MRWVPVPPLPMQQGPPSVVLVTLLLWVISSLTVTPRPVQRPRKGSPLRWAVSISAFHVEGKLRLAGAGSWIPRCPPPPPSPSSPGNTKVCLCDGGVTGPPKPSQGPPRWCWVGRGCDGRHPDASGTVCWVPR